MTGSLAALPKDENCMKMKIPNTMKTNSMPLLLASIAAFAMTMTGYSQSPPKVTVRLGQAVYWTTEGNDVVWLVVERGNDVAQEPFTVQYATSDLNRGASKKEIPISNAGLNVLVFKVVNEASDWKGSIRLTDAAGQPVKGIKVTLTP